MPLTASQTRYLRGLAHALKPVVTVGGKGVTDAVLKELDHALDDHELVKVKLGGDDRKARTAELARLAGANRAEPVQAIGRIAVLYRHNAERPRIALPR